MFGNQGFGSAYGALTQSCSSPTGWVTLFCNNRGISPLEVQISLVGTPAPNLPGVLTSALGLDIQIIELVPNQLNIADNSLNPDYSSDGASYRQALQNTAAVLGYGSTNLIVPTPTPSTQSVDQGTTASISDDGASGGSNSYNYQWMEEAPGQQSFSNAQACVSPTSTTCSFSTTSSTQTGTYLFELQATNSYSNIANSIPATVTLNSALIPVAPSSSASTISQGQSSTLTEGALSTGTAPYTYQWLEEAPGSSTYSQISGATSSSYEFSTSTSTTPGTYLFEVQVTDSATSPTTADSSSTSIVLASSGQSSASTMSVSTISVSTVMTVSPPPGGGTGGGPGGGGGPLGPVSVPFKNSTDQGYNIFNITQDNTVRLQIGTWYNITDNFLSPNSTGVSVNGNRYTLQKYMSVLVSSSNGIPVYLSLANISYLPILHSATLVLYTPSSNSVSTFSTTSVPPKTSSYTTTIRTIQTTIQSTSTINNTKQIVNLGLSLGIAAIVIVAIGYYLIKRGGGKAASIQPPNPPSGSATEDKNVISDNSQASNPSSNNEDPGV